MQRITVRGTRAGLVWWACAAAVVLGLGGVGGWLPGGEAYGQCGTSIVQRLGGDTTAVARVNAGTLAVGRGTEVELLNLTNPSSPSLFSPRRRVGLSAPPVKISMTQGSPWMFVLKSSGRVSVVPVSYSPSVTLGSVVAELGQDAVDVLGDGTRVFIAELDSDANTNYIFSRLRSYELLSGSPTQLFARAPFLQEYGFDRLAKVGNVVWAGIHELNSSLLGVEGYDVSNPTSPVRVATSLNNAPLGSITRVTGMEAIGSRLMLSFRQYTEADGQEDRMRAVEVGVPSAPEWFTPTDVGGFVWCMSSAGSHVRVSVTAQTIRTWNTSSPGMLSLLGSYTNSAIVVRQMVAGVGRDYWAAGRPGLYTMNTSDPAAISTLSVLGNTPARPTVVRQYANVTAVLETQANSLRLYDFTLSESLQLRSSVGVPAGAALLEMANLSGGTIGLACVATKVPGSGDTITIIDVTNPNSPVVRSTITGFEAQLMSAWGSRLYVLTTDNELKIIELAVPTAPAVRSTTAYGGGSSSFTCMTSWSNAVALGSRDFGLWLINTTNATSPLVSGIWNPETNYRPIALTKGPNYLYVHARTVTGSGFLTSTRLETLTVTNLASPSLRWLCTEGSGAGSQGLFNALTYVSSPSGKFLVGTRPQLSADDWRNEVVVYELPGGLFTNEGVPFPVGPLGLPGVIGNVAPSATGATVAAVGSSSGMYRVAMPTQWRPGFGLHPQSQSVCMGGSVLFSAVASGNPTTVHYQWYRYPPVGPAVLLTDGPTPWGSMIDGSMGTGLTISNARPADRGWYVVLATNTCGSIQSALALLSMCTADFNCSGTVTVDDIFAFLSAWFAGSSSADFNSNGVVNVDDIFAFLSDWFAGCP